jgi:hypothetical protein
MRPITRLTLLLVAVTPLAVAGGPVYRWVDTDGSVQYSERPPPGVKAEVVPLHHAPASTDQSAQDLKRAREKAGLGTPAGQGAPPASATVPPTQEQQAARDQQRAENCRIAQENLRVLEASRRVIARDAQGNEIRLDDTQRQARLEETRQQIDKFCGPGR